MHGTYSPLGANSHISNQTSNSNFFATWEDETELEGDKTVEMLFNAGHIGNFVDLTGAEIGIGGSCCKRLGGFLEGVDNLRSRKNQVIMQSPLVHKHVICIHFTLHLALSLCAKGEVGSVQKLQKE